MNVMLLLLITRLQGIICRIRASSFRLDAWHSARCSVGRRLAGYLLLKMCAPGSLSFFAIIRLLSLECSLVSSGVIVKRVGYVRAVRLLDCAQVR